MMGKDRKPLGLLAVLAVSAILVSAVLAVNADAARGAGKGGGKGGSGTPTYTGTCAAAPNPVNQYGYVTISGSGATANGVVGYTLVDAGGTSGGWVTANATGQFTLEYQPVWLGTTTVTFGGVATCSFQVI